MNARLTKNNDTWRTIKASKKEDLAEWLAESWIESQDSRDIEYCHSPNEFYRIKDFENNIDLKMERPSQDEIIEKLSNQNWGEYTLEIDLA